MVANPGYADQRSKRLVLRVVGVVAMTIALALTTIALLDFFTFDSGFADPFSDEAMSAEPTKFWMFFLALPFFVAGAACLQAGFLGAASRFAAGETMPVARDSMEYLTRGQGLGNLGRAEPADGPYCRGCGTRNDTDARFCDGCGQGLA
ncbi:zinc ribbon domain-containing protein [Nocardioides donggukensis]|uniref:Zinc ribbon domain-containing protein n=1 Tax=Nocardioides donggukensis TaxID=2774019 RepID=A0A927Q3L9_9ACTN|nr:zinc ribbon domain-containing protein [Nocardioides donggukensis]MBD8870721.1 zinc ribbon domain-containing protein [Nocardioides donggukensis]